jgi:S1-C subfamily serine protease
VLCVLAAGCAGEASADPAAFVVPITTTGCRPTSNIAYGVVVDDELVATVAHAVAGEDEIDVAGRSGIVVAIDTVLDAAVLRVEGLDAEIAGRRPYVDGEEVALFTDGEQPADVTRRVTVRTSDIYGEGEHARPALDTFADARAGDSGAPIVGDDGSVLAILWAASRQTDDRAWALPIEALEPVIAAAHSGAPPPSAACAR